MATVEFYQDDSEKKEWRWRVKARNGEILGSSSEGYSRKGYAENNLKSLPLFCLPADVKVAAEDMGNSTRPLAFYQDDSEKKEWRWRITAANGHITHASSEGFSSKQNAVDNLAGLNSAVQAWNAAG